MLSSNFTPVISILHGKKISGRRKVFLFFKSTKEEWRESSSWTLKVDRIRQKQSAEFVQRGTTFIAGTFCLNI